jgi:hypothetical protein
VDHATLRADLERLLRAGIIVATEMRQ